MTSTTNTLERCSQKSRIIRDFFASTNPGEYYSYNDIAQITGIKMISENRNYLRKCADKVGIEYEVTPGLGITIASAQNSISILSRKAERVDSAVRRLETTHKNLTPFQPELSPGDQRQLAVFGAGLAMLKAARSDMGSAIESRPLVVKTPIQTERILS